jgi:hypothetical protein
MNRLADAIAWLSSQFSATRDEFRQEHQDGADMLLDGMLSKGYAWTKGGRYAVTNAGRRASAHLEPVSE